MPSRLPPSDSEPNGFPANGRPANGRPSSGFSSNGVPASGSPLPGYPSPSHPSPGYPSFGQPSLSQPSSEFPFVQELQRLANELFAGGSGTGASATNFPGGIGAPGVGFTPAGAQSGGSLGSLPLGSLGSLPLGAPSHALPHATPFASTGAGLPMGLSGGGSPFAADAASPAYYFLEEARRAQNVPSSPGVHHSLDSRDNPGALTRPGAPARPDSQFVPEPIGAQLQPRLEGLTFGHANFDVNAVRRDFPILQERVSGGKQLIWLDNAATTQKPQAVIDRIAEFYMRENSNIHRGAHELAARATDAYEKARDLTARFLNAPSSQNIVFVRGATEAINLVAKTWGRQHVGEGDEVLITWLEHHANIVPWQQLCAEKNARLRVAPVDDHGQIMIDEYQRLLGPRTRLVSFPQVSNALGTITPAREMVEIAHRFGAKVLVDGAQAVSHMRADVQTLDCDWYVFSGHKVFAPTGIGVLFGKAEILEASPPWQGGGNMIQDVTFEKTIYHKPPSRFEAGTGNIADAVGLGAAIEYVNAIGIDNIARYEHELLEYATSGLRSVPGLKLIGTAPDKAGVLSFVLSGLRTEEVGSALNREGIAVRAGHHCAQPILRRFGLESTVRPSLALYNTCAEIDALVEALLRLRQARRDHR